MGARENKQLLQSAFAELAQGNGKPFGDLMADDFCWQAIGTTAWSRPFRGKQAVMDELMRPLFAQFADRYTNTAIRMIAEDDYVAVECRGRVMTKSGKAYNNQYCYVIRFADGKMRELMEYFDTELVTAALDRKSVGEEARVKLESFDLKGSQRASIRTALNKAERNGIGFELIPTERVGEVMDELQRVSNAWLAEHAVREKSFSLGAFDRRYIGTQPVAVLKRQGRILAFANTMTTALKDEATVDLMRFDPDAPHGSMEVLFARLLMHFKQEGYAWFSLGMAPLAGLSGSPVAPMWHRVGKAAFDHGEAFYNFRGLRAFKNKFDPVWTARYMAVAGGLSPLLAIADVTVLISGGIRGVIAK